MTEENNAPLVKEGWAWTAIRGDGNFAPVLFDVLGTLILGVLAIMLLLALQRERARNQALWELLLEQEG